MGLIEQVYPEVKDLDFNDTNVKVKIVASSALTFFTVYVMSALVSQATWTYRNLRKKEKIFWNLAVMRGAFGLCGTVVGVWAVWFDEVLHKDVVWAVNPSSQFIVCFTVGFFLVECALLTYSDVMSKTCNYLLHFHHYMALFGFFFSITTHSGHFFACVSLMLEMTTPFSCICWTLLKCNLAHTKVWKLNQLVLVHLFHCRTLVEGFMIVKSFNHWPHIWASMPWSTFSILYSGLVVSFIYMTPFWTYKKTKQLVNPVDWNFEDSERTRIMNGHVPSGQ